MRLGILFLLIACHAVICAPIPIKAEVTDAAKSNTYNHHTQQRSITYLANRVAQLLGRDEVYIPFGPLKGTATRVEGVKRYVIEYARTKRWEHSRLTDRRLKSLERACPSPSQVTSSIRMLTSESLSRHLPPVCPQQPSYIIPSSIPQSEDCLYLTIYAPSSTSIFKRDLPILVW